MEIKAASEWSGFQTFPEPTQAKLDVLFGNLNQQNVNTLTILVMGKGGVGKSSIVNSILGERVSSVTAFQEEGSTPLMFSRSRGGFTLNIIDTPGLVSDGQVNKQTLSSIRRFLLNKTIDVLIYVCRLDAYRVGNLDRDVAKAITDNFGKEIWRRCLVALTHAQFTPPSGLDYIEYFAERSEAVLKFIRSGACINQQEFQDHGIPVALVENSWRCETNGLGEKIVPDGTVWIPNLMEVITGVALNGSGAISVVPKVTDSTLFGKLVFIPMVLIECLLVKLIKLAIDNDIAKETKSFKEQHGSDFTS
ncbi:translocase of chloroplast 34-like isoform X2 [Dioscorea cayenensis subsp. rotundata]|nr:translocase of chloroplast 34-like isoform X2 [Dioscorea cayenensis subsp. rotundata]XP_039124789.1 translocase of chloroplast 34-like isoform X2 [Dioscorea cayenensis subsp. rotundata]